MSYLVPQSLTAMVLAESPIEAVSKFEEASECNKAPVEYRFQIDSVELVQENVDEDQDPMEYFDEVPEKGQLN